MIDEKTNLSVLVNNESFLRWLRGCSSLAETKHWQKWHAESAYNQEMTSIAKKIVSMPFLNPDIDTDEVQAEKEKFDKYFMRLIKKSEYK